MLNRSSRRVVRRFTRKAPVVERLWAGVKRLLQLDDTPESVARGVALGLIIAFTPTVGIQMGMVLVIHTLCRANRLAGIAMVWISNPLTLVPIYWFDYLVGRAVLGTTPITYARFQQIYDLRSEGAVAQMRELIDNLRPVLGDVAIPMFLGGLLVGLAIAIPAYPLTIRLVELERRGKARLEELRARRRQRHEERKGRGAPPAAQAPSALEPPPFEPAPLEQAPLEQAPLAGGAAPAAGAEARTAEAERSATSIS